ncbi:lytic polysaccharide monooxygenase [Microbacterium resistens]|uniref:Lytic polysaccharide monooxygenase n=1 Tax=Microbacterium resistens TaxID=156977 RepID=A0ABY3RNV3_9MICO|nr:lytic polysaccharide monooxygenase [Microbacterium resistens]UGS25648.1 lytic polysaccharide monooxygenase [Microbacterium resistens]
MKSFAKIGTCTALVGAIVLGGAVAANAHGYVGNDKNTGAGISDVQSRASMKGNTDIGNIQWEPQSLEAPKGFTLDPATGGPADGKLGSVGRADAVNLDQQSPERWKKNEVKVGQELTIAWHYTAPHQTTDWRYYITKNGWDQNKPLTRADLQPLAEYKQAMGPATNTPSHKVTLPADHTGNHVIYAVWDVADTSNAFYNMVDLHIDGQAGPEQPVEAPADLSGLLAGEVTHNSAKLSWNVAQGADRYDIERSTNGGDFSKVGSVKEATYTDVDLAASTEYTYRVTAVNNGGASAPATTTVVTKDAPVDAAPTAPGHVHSMGTTSDSVDLMWTASTSAAGIDRYEIHRAFQGGVFTKVAETSKTRYLDTALKASTAYEYKVVAIDKNGQFSDASKIFTVTTNAEETGPVDPSVQAWDSTAYYTKGDRVSHNGHIYEAVQSHQGHGDPNWIDALSLWKKIG